MIEREIRADHPIRIYFAQALHACLGEQLGLAEGERVEPYLLDMLLRFLHEDGIYSLRDNEGRRVDSIAEMVAEGDIRLRADSFKREREVHRHIGDFLLFWSGVFPEFLKKVKGPVGADALLDPVGQGRLSYHVASTFDYDPYTAEAQVFRRLSDDFEGYRYGLSLFRTSLDRFPMNGWTDGFQA